MYRFLVISMGILALSVWALFQDSVYSSEPVFLPKEAGNCLSIYESLSCMAISADEM